MRSKVPPKGQVGRRVRIDKVRFGYVVRVEVLGITLGQNVITAAPSEAVGVLAIAMGAIGTELGHLGFLPRDVLDTMLRATRE